jgi:hypothetical protein
MKAPFARGTLFLSGGPSEMHLTVSGLKGLNLFSSYSLDSLVTPFSPFMTGDRKSYSLDSQS